MNVHNNFLGGGMFGQDNNDQQQPNDDHNIFGQPSDTFGGPAPGAPAGPINQAAPTPFDSPQPDQPQDQSVPAPDPLDPGVPPAAPVADSPVGDELLDIKQDALHELTPLVDHLDQSPEEKFRTTMMMIQASDDQSLVKIAYDAAKQITDEKARAQALLDVVNEINYFTQQHQS